MIERVVLIGAGKVASHLGRRLQHIGVDVVQVYSRSMHKSSALAQDLGSESCNEWDQIQPDADLYILAVSDDAIVAVASMLSPYLPKDSLVVHTSGATPTSLLAPHFAHFGVFYPLQTFSKESQPDWSIIPICIHAAFESDITLLHKLANKVSGKVYPLDDRQRERLHVAAVVVNNFVNHLYQTGQDILEKENIPFQILRPLILETAQKVQYLQPRDAQTGPAIRGDQATIERHLSYLDQYPEWKELYELISRRIEQS